MKSKKVPMRMCVSCREMKPKRELIRVVRGEEAVSVDSTGKAAGRGAYICGEPACLQKAKKSRALERALNHKVEAEVYDKVELLWERRKANLDTPKRN